MQILLQFLKLINNIFSVLPRKQIEKVVALYDAMHKLMEESSVERFLILKTHNGGGLIKSSTPLYISALYEDYTSPLGSVKSDIQNIQLDEEFIRMLLELCRNKVYRSYTKDVKSDFLRTFLEGDNITFIELRFIKEDRKNLYISSFVTTNPEQDFDTPVQQTAITVAVTKLRNNIG